jgi:hypothetical protein
VRCCGWTKEGRSCRAFVPGLSRVEDPRAWADGQGGRCSAHA